MPLVPRTSSARDPFLLPVCDCGGTHAAYVMDTTPGAGHAVTCPVRIAHPFAPDPFLESLEEKLRSPVVDPERPTPMETFTIRAPSRPPAPDPCLVSVTGGGIGNPSEKAWRKARNCPLGCGRHCAKSQRT